MIESWQGDRRGGSIYSIVYQNVHYNQEKGTHIANFNLLGNLQMLKPLKENISAILGRPLFFL